MEKKAERVNESKIKMRKINLNIILNVALGLISLYKYNENKIWSKHLVSTDLKCELNKREDKIWKTN